jgi:hypothetical protein
LGQHEPWITFNGTGIIGCICDSIKGSEDKLSIIFVFTHLGLVTSNPTIIADHILSFVWIIIGCCFVTIATLKKRAMKFCI